GVKRAVTPSLRYSRGWRWCEGRDEAVNDDGRRRLRVRPKTRVFGIPQTPASVGQEADYPITPTGPSRRGGTTEHRARSLMGADDGAVARDQVHRHVRHARFTPAKAAAGIAVVVDLPGDLHVKHEHVLLQIRDAGVGGDDVG